MGGIILQLARRVNLKAIFDGASKIAPRVLVAILGTVGLSKLANDMIQEEPEALEVMAKQMGQNPDEMRSMLTTESKASTGNTDADVLGYRIDEVDNNKVSLFNSDGSLNIKALSIGAGLAALIALLVYGLATNRLQKHIGDALATLLRLIPGLEGVADSVDKWGEEPNATGTVLSVGKNVSDQSSSYQRSETILRMLREMFSGDDQVIVTKLKMLMAINVDELEEYVAIKRNIAAAIR